MLLLRPHFNTVFPVSRVRLYYTVKQSVMLVWNGTDKLHSWTKNTFVQPDSRQHRVATRLNNAVDHIHGTMKI
jgi:hypothetical protein